MPLPGPKSSTNSFSQYDQPYIDGSYIAANGVNICYYTDDSDLLPHLLDLYTMLHEASQYLSDWGRSRDGPHYPSPELVFYRMNSQTMLSSRNQSERYRDRAMRV